MSVTGVCFQSQPAGRTRKAVRTQWSRHRPSLCNPLPYNPLGKAAEQILGKRRQLCLFKTKRLQQEWSLEGLAEQQRVWNRHHEVHLLPLGLTASCWWLISEKFHHEVVSLDLDTCSPFSLLSDVKHSEQQTQTETFCSLQLTKIKCFSVPGFNL